MSTPHIAWAFAQRKLTAIQRLVLIALAERANGELTCFPSEKTLAYNCELSRRSVSAAVQYLHDERHLIEVIKDPVERAAILAKAGARVSARVNVYRILRPTNGASLAHSNSARAAPSKAANSAKRAPSKAPIAQGVHHTPSIAQGVHHTDQGNGANPAAPVSKPCTSDGAPRAHEPLTESLHEEKRRASAPEEAKASSAGKKEGGTPPSAPPAPAPPPQTTTTTRSDAYRQPGTPQPPTDDFNSYLDAPLPTKALPAEIEREVLHGEVLAPHQPIGPQATNAFVHSLARNFQNNYPARAPRLSPAEQIELCQPKPTIKPLYAPDAELRAARIALAQRAAATASPP